MKTRIEIHTDSEWKFAGPKIRKKTIDQLIKSGGSVKINQYDKNGDCTMWIKIDGDNTISHGTPVERHEVRKKRKYESNYDSEKEMQIQMGTLFYSGRREYDSDGKKGIKVTYQKAAEVILKFFQDVLPVQVETPCFDAPGGVVITKEAPIGYLRHKCGDSAVKSLAKAICRRYKNRQQTVL